MYLVLSCFEGITDATSRHARQGQSRGGAQRAGTIALGTVAAITLAACGGGNAAKGTGSSTSATSTAKANGPVQVALILKDFTNPYFISMENSAKADAAKLGVKLAVSAGSRTATRPRRSAPSTTRSPRATPESSSPPTATP